MHFVIFILAFLLCVNSTVPDHTITSFDKQMDDEQITDFTNPNISSTKQIYKDSVDKENVHNSKYSGAVGYTGDVEKNKTSKDVDNSNYSDAVDYTGNTSDITEEKATKSSLWNFFRKNRKWFIFCAFLIIAVVVIISFAYYAGFK